MQAVSGRLQLFIVAIVAVVIIALAAVLTKPFAPSLIAIDPRPVLPQLTDRDLTRHSSRSAPGKRYQCVNPYSRQGFIWMEDKSSEMDTSWVPFYEGTLQEKFAQIWDDKGQSVDPTTKNVRYYPDIVPPSELLKSAPTSWIQLIMRHRILRKAVAKSKTKENDAAGVQSQDKLQLRQLDEQLSWVRGRRILIVGDSVDEDLTANMCEMLGSSIEYRKGRDSDEHLTAICKVQELNLTIVYWQIACVGNSCPSESSNPTVKAVAIEDRWQQHFLPTADTAVGANGMSPDLVILQTGLSDVQDFVNAHKERYHSKSADYARVLTYRELVFYMQRVRYAIYKLRALYGDHLPIIYRSISLKNTDDGDTAAVNLDQAARFACREVDVEVMEFGHIMRGYYSFYDDDVHLKRGPLTVLWANMVFWYLFRSQGGVEVRGELVKMPEINGTVAENWKMCHEAYMNDPK
ncbi:hypothetical protein V1517DRAFT_327243 [Lipomyces orientalis]|uniref:Uncharacterized protein n=1 Tax=Lipomyces orientalis TaxID=1233043 RepID=A0ACC3TJ08_9ASCO